MTKPICTCSFIPQFLRIDIDYSKNYLSLKKRVMSIALTIFEGLLKAGMSFCFIKSITDSLRKKIMHSTDSRSLFEWLPAEIAVEIFSHAGIKELGLLASVSKDAKALAEGEILWKDQLKKQGFSMPPEGVSAKTHYYKITKDKTRFQSFVRNASKILDKYSDKYTFKDGHLKEDALQSMIVYYILTKVPRKEISNFIDNNLEVLDKITKIPCKNILYVKMDYIEQLEKGLLNKKQLRNKCINQFVKNEHTWDCNTIYFENTIKKFNKLFKIDIRRNILTLR